MENGSRLEKSTGYIPSITTGKGNESAPVESTDRKNASPVLKNAPTKDASLTSGAAVSDSNILAVQVMMGDFKELKNQLPASWQTSGSGKIYWCAELPGHILAIENGKLLVDGTPVVLSNKLLEE